MKTDELELKLTANVSLIDLYFDNAKEQIVKAQKVNNEYTQNKYVRSACGTLYLGLLIIMDEILFFYNQSLQRGEKNYANYMAKIKKLNQSWAKSYQDAYNLLHLKGYYGERGEFTPEDWQNAKKIVNDFYNIFKKLNNITA